MSTRTNTKHQRKCEARRTYQNVLNSIFRKQGTNLGIFVVEGVLAPWTRWDVCCSMHECTVVLPSELVHTAISTVDAWVAVSVIPRRRGNDEPTLKIFQSADDV